MISQTIHWAARILFWVALVLVFAGVFKRNRGSAKLCSDGRVRFAPRWWFVCSWVFIVVRFGFTSSGYFRAGSKEPLQFVIGALICVTAIGCLLSIPGNLIVTNEALEERNWIWRNKKIRWTEIQEIHTERGSTVTVIGASRRKIIYTNVYPDRCRFLQEIKKHCGDELPSNFPDQESASGVAIRN